MEHEYIYNKGVKAEKGRWIEAIENAVCDMEELRAKDHKRKIFEYYDKQ
jgi:hypothetical protein